MPLPSSRRFDRTSAILGTPSSSSSRHSRCTGPARPTRPPDEQSWATLLRGLTPEWPGDEPWSLVAPADRPAFMQPPVPGGDLAPFKTVIEAPDALDMLVTSKNHDLKGGLMADALPDDWLFALVSLQTTEGFMGRGITAFRG